MCWTVLSFSLLIFFLDCVYTYMYTMYTIHAYNAYYICMYSILYILLIVFTIKRSVDHIVLDCPYQLSSRGEAEGLVLKWWHSYPNAPKCQLLIVQLSQLSIVLKWYHIHSPYSPNCQLPRIVPIVPIVLIVSGL